MIRLTYVLDVPSPEMGGRHHTSPALGDGSPGSMTVFVVGWLEKKENVIKHVLVRTAIHSTNLSKNAAGTLYS